MSRINLGKVVGNDGKSAYQIWLEQGNTGTEQDFIESLIGKDGKGISKIEKTATNGLIDTYTITYTDGTTSTYEVTNVDGTTGNDLNIPSDLKIICCGDSLTCGDYGSEPEGTANTKPEGYPYFLAKYLNKTIGTDVINLGMNGGTPSNWYPIFERNKNHFKHENNKRVVVLMMFGANGGFADNIDEATSSGDPATYTGVVGSYCREIEEIMSLSEGHAHIILFGAPYVDPTRRERYHNNVLTANPITKKIAEKYNLPYVDTYSELGLSALNTSVLQPIDGLHFGYSGYSRLGTFIGSKLRSLLSFDYSNESSSVVNYTITYKYVDTDGNTIKANTIEQVAKGVTKTFTINNAPAIIGYTVSSVNPTSATISTDITVVYTYTKEQEAPDTPTKYTIINNLTNITTSNSITEIESGASYNATLTTLDNYIIDTVVVKMNNVDITSSVYNNGSITISNVTGDIVITAIAINGNIEETLIDFSAVEKEDISIHADGTTKEYAAWYTYENIDCSNYKSIRYVDVPCYDSNNIYICGISFYNEANEFISGVGVKEANETRYIADNNKQAGQLMTGCCIVPEDAKYIRVAYADGTKISGGSIVNYTTAIYGQTY